MRISDDREGGNRTLEKLPYGNFPKVFGLKQGGAAHCVSYPCFIPLFHTPVSYPCFIPLFHTCFIPVLYCWCCRGCFCCLAGGRHRSLRTSTCFILVSYLFHTCFIPVAYPTHPMAGRVLWYTSAHRRAPEAAPVAAVVAGAVGAAMARAEAAAVAAYVSYPCFIPLFHTPVSYPCFIPAFHSHAG